jgi:hypothetical protein
MTRYPPLSCPSTSLFFALLLFWTTTCATVPDDLGSEQVVHPPLERSHLLGEPTEFALLSLEPV